VQSFRHNLSPVEVKKFLTIVKELNDNLCFLYCLKVPVPCPKCGEAKTCHSGALSYYSSSVDKITHEIRACLACGWKQVTTVLTVEKM